MTEILKAKLEFLFTVFNFFESDFHFWDFEKRALFPVHLRIKFLEDSVKNLQRFLVGLEEIKDMLKNVLKKLEKEMSEEKQNLERSKQND